MGDIGHFWLPCLGPFVFLLLKRLNYLAFQSFDIERAWWRLFQKRVVRTKYDIYVFIETMIITFIMETSMTWNKSGHFSTYKYLCFWKLCVLEWYSIRSPRLFSFKSIKGKHINLPSLLFTGLSVRAMVFNATFNNIFNYIVSFIDEENWSTRRTPSICHKSLTNFTR